MKTQKLFQIMVLFVVAAAPFFFPTPAEAVPPPTGDTPWFFMTGQRTFEFYAGKYDKVTIAFTHCNGRYSKGTFLVKTYNQNEGRTLLGAVKSFSVVFFNTGSETITGSTKYCEPEKPSYCSNFSIPKRVPRSPATPVSFKGPGNITSAKVYFKNLKYSLPLWLHRYDWGSGKWHGYLNTLLLPTGKHHGRLTTYVDGVRGGGCATGGFKVVEE